MTAPDLPPSGGFEAIYRRNVNTVWNVCITFLRNPADAEDAVQETFLRLLRSDTGFDSAIHEKAWLIRTAQNVCKDELSRARRRDVPLEAAPEPTCDAPELDETLRAMRTLPDKQRLALPQKYCVPIFLHYYEGYSAVELSTLLCRPAATIRSDLRRGREALRELLGGDFR